MIDGNVYADTRLCVEDLIQDAATALNRSVRTVLHLTVENGSIAGPFPVFLINPPRGEEGFLDRVDRLRIECYTPDEDAVDVLEAVKALMTGTDIETANGYLDSVKLVTTPEDVPYTETMNRADMVVEVTTRPLN